MVERLAQAPASLYLADETAWLELTAQLVAEGRWHEVDRDNLSEYLTDMAIRDRREVMSRLVVLLTHLLKWEHQPDQRNGSWQATIDLQRLELGDLLESRTLLNHAQDILAKAYERATSQAAKETGLAVADFPAVCPHTLDDVLGAD
jgi:Domain of unknown function DUF29